MKRLKTFLLVLFSICAIHPVMAWGEGDYIEVDGIAYEYGFAVYKGEENILQARIVKRKDGQPYSGDVVIPQYIIYNGEDTESGIHHGDSILVTNILWAFSGSNITSLSLPSSIIFDDKSSLGNCKYLKSLELPEGLGGIMYANMFYGCESLESLSLPSTFEEWGSVRYRGAFSKCPHLKKVIVAPDHPKYDSRDNCNAVIETATNTLMSASAGTVLIPNTIDSIGRSAFEGLTIDSIYIPENIKFIDAVLGTGFVWAKDVGSGKSGYSAAANISVKCISAKDCEIWCNMKTRCYFYEQPNDPTNRERNYDYKNPRAGLPLHYEKLYLGNILVKDTLIIPGNVKRVANFFASRYLKSVFIPSSVEEVASYAFFGCDSLIEVHFADGVETIGEAAFASCCSITSLSLPSTLQSVGRGAFGGCSKLEVVALKAAQPPVAAMEMFDETIFQNAALLVPKGSKSLYEQAEGWKQFQTIVDDIDNMDNFHLTFEADGYLYHVIDADKKEVEIIPDYDPDKDWFEGVNGNWETAYNNDRYKGDIVIPEIVEDNGITYTVTRLGYMLFEPKYKHHGSKNIETDITSVRIPKSIKEIQTELAHYDIYIEDLAAWCNINFTNKYGKLPDTRFTLPQNLYVNNQLVTDLVIPEGVSHISDAAFMGFHGIKSLTLPASIHSIGIKAFCRSKLKEVTIPANVQHIGMAAFEGCNVMTSLTIEDGVAEIDPAAFADCLSLTKVSIPSSVKNIGNFAFRWCNSMEELTIADGVNKIGEWAFYQCEKLDKVKVPSSVKTIGRSAFAVCKGLKTVNLTEGLESIDRYAFENCTSLESLHIPASVKFIGRNVVEDCRNLKNLTVAAGNTVYNTKGGSNMIFDSKTNTIVAAAPEADIPQDVEKLGDYAFAYFSDRQNFIIPNGVKVIGNSAFLHCWSLHTITIPESVMYIGHTAFDACEGLTEIVAMMSKPCQIEDDAFSIIHYRKATLYVPDNFVGNYRAAEGWKQFKHIEGISTMSIGIPPVIDRSAGKMQVNVDGQRVLLKNLSSDESISVYTLNGSMVKKVKAAPDGKAIIVLPGGGIYMIRTQEKVIKVSL